MIRRHGEDPKLQKRWKWIIPGQIITTSAEVTLNGGLVRESPQNPLNSGLGIILICPDHPSGWKLRHPIDMHVDLGVRFIGSYGNETCIKIIKHLHVS